MVQTPLADHHFTRILANNIESTWEQEKEERAKKTDAIANDKGSYGQYWGMIVEGLRGKRANEKKWRCWR
jgi:hypothetical protein